MSVPATLVFDDVVIDFAGRQLLRGGVAQALEPKAFAVLALLAGAPGHLFTRDEILDAVWGHRHVTPGVLNRVITLLRHALGEDAHAPRYLHTAHGIGYRLDLPPPVVPEAPASVADAAPEAPAPSLPKEEEPASAVVPRAVPRATPAPDPASPAPGPCPQRRATDLVAVAAMAPPRRRRAGDGHVARHGWRSAWLLLAVLALAGLALWSQATRHAPAATSPAAVVDARSIAVLPLANADGNKAEQFFVDGISENLINALSAYGDLKVIGRSSSFRFRDSNEGSRVIGAKLGVAYLLDGSVQRAGDSVRVRVELVDAADGRTLWTQRFDRSYRNLFALQDEIALSVAGVLREKLPHFNGVAGVAETGRPASGNLQAYDAFLRGTYAMLRENDKAIEQFSAAIRLDPEYAQAWQWLGFARAVSARFRLDDEAMVAECARARREIETAIRLAPENGLGYSALAVQMTACDYDWGGALAQYRKAMPLVPAGSPAHAQYSRLLATLGQVEAAIAERRKYLEGDPLTVEGNYWQFLMEASLGRLEAAAASLRKVVELEEPGEADWYGGEASYLAILRGDAATARAQAERVPQSTARLRVLALATQIGSNREEADAALDRLLKADGDSRVGAYHIARVYALRGDAENMFRWLDRDLPRHGLAAHQVLYDPLLLRFRDDPRLAAFCRRAGLPPPAGSDALDIDRIRAANARLR